jgi:hypothetical protein
VSDSGTDTERAPKRLTGGCLLARLPGSSWNFDGDPTGIVMVRR